MINAVSLFLGSIYIFYVSIERIIDPQMPDAYWMLGMSVVGIFFNGLGVWKLKSGKSLNKQVMMVHLLEDVLGWITVLIGSVVLVFYDLPIIDPILAIAINLTVLIFALSKLVKAFKILLQKVPDRINLPEIRQKILCLNHVKEVLQLNIWSVTQEEIVVTVQVQLGEVETLSEVEEVKQQIQEVFGGVYENRISIDIKY